MEIQIQTWTNRTKTPTPAGNELLPQYIETLDAKGKRYLKKSSEKNIYEMIQASKNETLIYNILEKYKQTGDESLLNRREAIYGDFTNIPKTPAEMQNLIMKADAAFETLDKDVRAAFENDAGIFKQSILNGNFEEKISKFIKKKEQPTEKPIEQKQEATTNE